tara:strand:+ start:372 stop:1208 length:837 start_codon:yes stop_codon:yes gene_type:complete
MAIGLIKKQIIRGTGSSRSPLMKTRNQQRLVDATTDYEGEMKAYKNQNFNNPYAKNVYAGLENTAEDLTVNQQAAQFQAQQTQQSQANILSALQSGGSFNAGNIQALANQAQTGAQQAAASIGQQESANQRMAAQQEARNQQLQSQGQLQVQKGAAGLQQMEADRQATQLGMSMQQVGNAQQAIAANKAMIGQIIGGVTSAVGSIAATSDRRLKKNINKIGKSPSGLNIYSFEYINDSYGSGVYQGVMSDEVPLEAVINNGKYDMVNYSMLDVEFKQI